MLLLRLLANCPSVALNHLLKSSRRRALLHTPSTPLVVANSAVPIRMSSSSSSDNNANSSQTKQPLPDASAMVTFLEHIGKLKHLKRTGWVIRNVDDCETVAGHMYRMAMMTYLLDDVPGGDDDDADGAKLDRAKCLELALVHDMAESIVGDLTPYCGVSKAVKMRRELDAMRTICEPLGARGERLMRLFEEYEAHQSPEARFVKELDRLDMVLQAAEYETRDACPGKLQEFFDSTDGQFAHPLIVRMVQQIKADRSCRTAAAAAAAAAASTSSTSE